MSGSTTPRLTSRQACWEQWKSNVWQAAGSQARPRSPVPAVASLDADRAVKTAEKEAALGRCESGSGGLDPDHRRNQAHERCQRHGIAESPPGAGRLPGTRR